MAVDRQQEDIQFQRRGARSLHGLGVFDPRVARADAVDAGDRRDARRGRALHELQELALVGVAEVTFEVLAGIAVALHPVQRGRLAENLLFEDRLQHHGSRALTDAPLDVLYAGRIGRAADDDGTRKFESEVFRFHETIPV